MIVIYKITSPSNKVYIGQTWNFKERLRRYKTLACKNQKKLFNSFDKYKVDSHIFETLLVLEDYVTQYELDIIEKFYIKFYDSFNNGLNLTVGGRGSKGYIFTKEDRLKISKKKIGKSLSISTRKKMSNYHKNRPLEHSINNIKARLKPVLQYDFNNNLIREWESLKSATSNNFGDIRSCINGRQKTAGGYIWKYK